MYRNLDVCALLRGKLADLGGAASEWAAVSVSGNCLLLEKLWQGCGGAWAQIITLLSAFQMVQNGDGNQHTPGSETTAGLGYTPKLP